MIDGKCLLLPATDDAVQHPGDASQLPRRAGGILAAVDDGQPGRRARPARVPARYASAASPTSADASQHIFGATKLAEQLCINLLLHRCKSQGYNMNSNLNYF